MSFDLTFYQPQLSASAGQSHVYQTIFLDKDWSGKLWTKDEIKQDLIIGEKWWKQQSHRWQHYARVVPWMSLINGTRGTWCTVSFPNSYNTLLICYRSYAGAWTGVYLLTFNLLSDASIVLNMHEIAITSGFAAAYRFGADFPHMGDEECVRLFRLYLGLSHATRLVSLCFID